MWGAQMKRKGNKPKTWRERKRRPTLKRSQLSRARKEAERRRKAERRQSGAKGVGKETCSLKPAN